MLLSNLFNKEDTKLEGSGLFPRPGGKSILMKQIINEYFPKNYEQMTYIEPFVGGGSIFFYKQPSIKEIINDIDKEVIMIYKGFKKYNGATISKDINGIYDKNKFEIIKNSQLKNPYDKFIKELLLYKLSFFGDKKTFMYGMNKDRKISSNFSNNKIKDRLKDVIILNKDYKDVIKKYDSDNAFFYLDPPYEEFDKTFYENINFEELKNILSNIKGLFVLSTNDSEFLRKLFSQFNIYTVKTKYTNPLKGNQTINKNELVITNFNNNINGAGKPTNIKLYNQIKKKIYKEQPKHSLYRSARVQKEYQDAGGEYEEDIKKYKMNINKWFNQKWLSVNDWLRGDEIKCGNSDTIKKYDEYPYCKKKSDLEKLNNNQIKKLINEKNKLKSKPLITEKVLKTDKFNIKDTMTGSAINNKFDKQLKDLNIDKNKYLKIAKQTAKDAGYNPELLNFSSNPKKKLNYDGVDFGAVAYNDFIIYKLIEPDIADEKRKNYRKRAKSVMLKTNNKLSPASLSYFILW